MRLSDKEYEALKRLSASTERSINELIREAIRQYAGVKQDTLG
ncbi:ribbon-helix-helix protein, CopG family [Coleofasciculus sp. E1-EBD-02]